MTANRVSRILALILVQALILQPMLTTAAFAAPQNATVVAGDVSIQTKDSTTLIHASDGSIIDYRSFDIRVNETVRFIQPSTSSRVLNRIRSSLPTHINGTLLANGQVYIVNPMGVFFGDGAHIDVGRLVAAAGHISNEDFLAGLDRFRLTGTVENLGQIQAQEAALVGNYVLNQGVIRGESVVVLAAGEDVFLMQPGEGGFVQIDRSVLASEAYRVVNSGTIDGGDGNVVMAAGDLYSLAIFNSGTIRGGDVLVDGGENGRVTVGGVVDVAGRGGNGAGGSVQILGDEIAIEGAAIDASGTDGGQVLIGGDYQGQGDTRTATRTFVDAGSTIKADAGTDGDGGKVIVWADGTTGFVGDISARGGTQSGDGGFVEVSGKEGLLYAGRVDTRAPNGQTGTLLLDPRDVLIDNAPGTPLTLNMLAFGTMAAADLTVDAGDISAALSNVVIQANRDIQQAPTGAINIAAANIDLTLQAGRDIQLDSTIVTNNGVVTLSANDPGADPAIRDSGLAPLPGSILMSPGSSITTGTADINLTVNPGAAGTVGDITLETLMTSGTINATTGGAIEAGSVADGISDVNAGIVNLTAGTGIGAAGTIELAANTISADTTSGNLDLSNGAAGTTTLTSLTTGAGTVSLDNLAGDLLVGTVSASGLATLNGGGAINDATVDTLVDITAGSIDLDAVTGIGNTNALELASTTIDADTTNGNIDLSNSSAVATIVNSLVTGTGTISFAQSGGGSVTFTNATTTDGAVTLSNDGGDLTATTVTAGGANNASLTTTTAGSVLAGSVTAAGDTITVVSADQIEESGADGASDLTAATLNMTAANGIGTAGTLEVSANTISADTTSGNVDLSNGAAGTTTLTSLTTGAGTVSLDNLAGDLLVGTVNAGGVASIATLMATGLIDDIAADAAVDITASSIILNGATGVGSTVANQLELATPNLSITTAGNVNVDLQASTLTDLALDLDPAGATLPYMVLNAANLVAFNLAAVGNDLHVGQIDVGAANFSLTNSNAAGAIDDATATDTTNDITAGSIVLTAGNGIGSGTDRELELASNTISADTTTGDIDLSNAATGGTSLNSLTTGTGDVKFANPNGDLLIGTVSASGLAMLSGGAAINDATVDTLVDITAGSIDLDALFGIGNTDRLELAATMIDADNSGTGNVDLSNSAAGTTTLASLTTGTGTVSLDNLAGDLLVGTVSASGLATLNGGGSINDATVDTLVDITAGAIDLDAVTGIGNTNALELASTTIDADNSGAGNVDLSNGAAGTTTLTSLTTGTGTVSLDNLAGDLLVGTVSASGLATLNVGGSINDATVDTVVDITAGSIDLDAVTGIGNTNALELASTTIDADTTNGNIDLSNSSAVATIVNSLVTGTGTISFAQSGGGSVTFTNATTTDGAVTLSNDGGDLTATTVTAGGANNASLTTTTAGSVLAGSVTAAGDTITVVSADQIEESGADGASDLTAATLNMTAANGIGTAGTLEVSSNTISADTTSGNVDLSNGAAGTTTLTSLTTGAGTVSLDNLAGDLLVGTVSASGLATLNGGGAINDATVDTLVDITAGSIDLDAVTGIGNTNALELASTTIDADTTNGNIDLSNSSAVATIVNSLVTGTGTISFAQSGGGSVTFTNATTTDGAVTLSNDGGDLTATTVTAGGANNASLTTTTAGSVLAGSVTAAGDTITVVSADQIEESGADGASDLTAATLNMTAANGIGTAGTLEVSANTISADTTSGNVDLSNGAAGTTTLTSLTTGAGTVSLDNLAGDLLVGTVSASGLATLNGGGAINDATVDTLVDITAGSIDLDAVTGIGNTNALELASTTIDADTTNGNIDLSNSSAVATIVNSLVTGTGTISFAQSGGGSVTFTNATTTDGAVTLSNDGGDLTATTVTAGGANNVSLTTMTSGSVLAGSVTAAGDTITVVSADQIEESGADGASDLTAATLNMTAANGIGTAGTLEVSANTISADTTSGNVDLSNGAAGTTTLTSLTTGAGTVSLDNLAGDLLVGTVSASGLATLNGGGSINDAPASDATPDITAGSIDLDAVDGIGNTNALELASTTIDADTTNGDVDLSNTSGAVTNVNSLTTGSGSVNLTQTGGGELVLGGKTIQGPSGVSVTSDGQIDLTGGLANYSTGGNGLTLNAVTQPISGNANPAGIFSSGNLLFDLDALGNLTIAGPGGTVAKISSTGVLEFRAIGVTPRTALIGDVTANVVRFAGSNLTATFQRQRTIPGVDLGVDLFANRVEIANTPTINANPPLSNLAGGGDVFFAVGDLLASLTPAQLAVIPLVLNNPNPQPGGIFLVATGGLQPVLGQDREFSPFLIQTPDGTISIPPLPAEVQLASLVQEPPVATDAPIWGSDAVTYIRCSVYEGEAPDVIADAGCSAFVGAEAAEADPRLNSESLVQARSAYASLYKDLEDMRDALQAAADSYGRSAEAGSVSGAGFRRFVDTQGAALAARNYMRRLSDYTRAVDAASAQVQEGAGELENFRDEIIVEVAPIGLSPDEFETAIEAGPEGSNVPRSWEPGYLVARDLPLRAFPEPSLVPAESGGM